MNEEGRSDLLSYFRADPKNKMSMMNLHDVTGAAGIPGS